MTPVTSVAAPQSMVDGLFPNPDFGLKYKLWLKYNIRTGPTSTNWNTIYLFESIPFTFRLAIYFDQFELGRREDNAGMSNAVQISGPDTRLEQYS
jgi:hypothetical protein